MSNPETHTVDLNQAKTFLAAHLGAPPDDVTLIGAGAWSRCFAFRQGADEQVIRFGRYVADFRKDQRAHAFAGPDLPVPEVIEIGPAFDGYYAISTRVRGIPLETVSVAQWQAVMPSVVAALEAMRQADLLATSGFGGWDAAGTAPCDSWADFLLAVGEDAGDARTGGWHDRLAAFPEGAAAFAWGLDRLRAVAPDTVPRALVHGDLLNRNVLVRDGRLTGVFDWGCSLYGDPLYDLAWFEFWEPWHPGVDVRALRAALMRRWRASGDVPAALEARLQACYLRIGLDHLLYHAHLGDGDRVSTTAARMRALDRPG
jgi:hygromycin-B 4-O-kinase